MTNRSWVVLLIATMCWTCVPAAAQNLVSPKLLPPTSVLRADFSNSHATFATESDQPDTAGTPHRHWSKGGKIMTIIGAGLIGAGTAALIHGQNTQVACSNGTCTEIAWRATGAIWMGGGAALVIVGATRRTTD